MLNIFIILLEESRALLSFYKMWQINCCTHQYYYDQFGS